MTHIKTIKILFVLLLFLISKANAQSKHTFQDKKLDIESKDVRDVGRFIINKISSHQTIDTSEVNQKKGLGPFITISPYAGYTIVTSYNFGIVSSTSFYTHNEKNAKLSSKIFESLYSLNKQSITQLRSNIWLKHEKINLYGDWRYYQFPNQTYGLGSRTSVKDIDPINFSYLRINEVGMHAIAPNLTAGLGYYLDSHWNISELDNAALTKTDLVKYGLTKKSISSAITFNLQFDNRLNSINTQGGFYANIQIRNNNKIIGSDANWYGSTIDMRYYKKLSNSRNDILAFWSYNAFTLGGNPPYFDLPSSGWDLYNNTARQYIEGRFRGKNLLYLESEYRFRLLKNGLLGGVLFTNITTATDISNKFNRIVPGIGTGLRIKLNKSSGTNLCIDYGFGIEGSRGFAFNINEIF